LTSTSSSTTTNSSTRHDLQHIKKKIEAGGRYYTTEELEAIWWEGYEQGSLDSVYSAFDQGYAAAIDDYELYWKERSNDYHTALPLYSISML
jgi:hypothetical protein